MFIQNDDVLWNRFLLAEINNLPKTLWLTHGDYTYQLDSFSAFIWLSCFKRVNEKKISKIVSNHPYFQSLDFKTISNSLSRTLKYLCKNNLLFTVRKNDKTKKISVPSSFGNIKKITGDFLPVHLFSINWNWTNKCNMNCRHCYSRPEHPESELTTEESLAVCRQICETGVCQINFGGGECLLRNDLFEILQYLNKRHVFCSLSSNGYAFSDNIAKELASAGLKKLNLSMDGHNAKIHDWMRRKPGSFDRVLKSVDLANKHNIKVNIQSLMTAKMLPFLKPMIGLAVKHGADQISFKVLKKTGNASRNTCLFPPQADFVAAIKFLNEASILYKDKINIDYGQSTEPIVKSIISRFSLKNAGDIKNPAQSAKGCVCGDLALCIKPNGNVTPCPLLPISMGNLKEKHLYEIWRFGYPLNKLRLVKKDIEASSISDGKQFNDLCLVHAFAQDKFHGRL